MAEAKREIERKYEGPAEGFGAADLTLVPEVSSVVDEGVVELDAVYYDTPDQRLAADKIVLRRRTGGSDAGWHLKLPVSPHKGVRDEIHAPLDEGGEDAESAPTAAASGPPAELTVLVRSRVRGAPLRPVVRLRSSRHLRHLLDDSGTLLAEVSVDRVRARRLSDGAGGGAERGGGPRGRSAQWTEAEVELAGEGSPAFLDTVDQHLRAAGWRPSGAPSKLARALEETSPEPDVATPAGGGRVPVDPSTAAGHVLAYLRTQRDAVVGLDPAVRRDLPDSVHQMRVATRRARSALRSYRNVLDRSVTAPLADELRWLAAELGVDRDQEVLTERLSAGLDGLPSGLLAGPARERLRSWSQDRRGGSRRRLLDVLDGERYLALLDALDGLLAAPPLRKAATRRPEKVLAKALRREQRRLAARLDEAMRQPEGAGRDAALHEARKSAKRVRYAAEAARPALGSAARKTVRRAKGLQTLLGDHQDSVMARQALRELAAEAGGAGESAFAFGVLYGREERHAADDEAILAGLDGVPRAAR